MSRILLTGFPGFLATGLVPRLLHDRPDQDLVCLIESHMRYAAEARLVTLQARYPDTQNRIELWEGDITLPQMGWSPEQVAALADIIHSKSTADRPKDRAVLPILYALQDEISRMHDRE